MGKELDFIIGIPLAKDYQSLRVSAGWHTIPIERIESALKNSIFTIYVVSENNTIAFGRIVGDGHTYFYIQDIIVSPEYRNNGIGTEIMKRLMLELDTLAPKKSGAFIGLMIAPGLLSFYQKFGFEEFPIDTPSMRIWRNGH